MHGLGWGNFGKHMRHEGVRAKGTDCLVNTIDTTRICYIQCDKDVRNINQILYQSTNFTSQRSDYRLGRQTYILVLGLIIDRNNTHQTDSFMYE